MVAGHSPGTGQRTRRDTNSRVAGWEKRYLTHRRRLIQRRLNQSACANTPSRVGERGLGFLMTLESQDLCFMSYRNYWGARPDKSKQLRVHMHMKPGLLQIAPPRHPPPPNLGQIHFLKALYTNAASQKIWVTFECCIVLIIFISLKHWPVIYIGEKNPPDPIEMDNS